MHTTNPIRIPVQLCLPCPLHTYKDTSAIASLSDDQLEDAWINLRIHRHEALRQWHIEANNMHEGTFRWLEDYEYALLKRMAFRLLQILRDKKSADRERAMKARIRRTIRRAELAEANA